MSHTHLPATTHWVRRVSGVRLPAVLPEHGHGLLGGFGVLRSVVLPRIAHCHRGYRVRQDLIILSFCFCWGLAVKVDGHGE